MDNRLIYLYVDQNDLFQEPTDGGHFIDQLLGG